MQIEMTMELFLKESLSSTRTSAKHPIHGGDFLWESLVFLVVVNAHTTRMFFWGLDLDILVCRLF